MKIQKLPPEIVKKLRSGIAFTNVAHCVEELVLNSIDAGASCIAVNLNLPLYQFQVIDNGCGIDAGQMKIIGTRYATSKCHSLKDLQNLKSGGFRGEALSSLKEISSILMIESRAASSTETYCKIFTQGKPLDPKKSLNSRPSKGTSVSVYDFMYNLPVRRKSISDALDLEESRKLLQSTALMYPNISFTLKNEANGEMCLQIKKCTSLFHSFLQIFGKNKANNLKNVVYQKECYEITGCISTDCHISKDLQFLYVNKRHVLRTKLHKLLNSILNKALSSRQKSNVNVSSLSPGQPNQSRCIFVLNISCPYDKYDIIFEPGKTMIEFSEWDSVLKIVEDTVIDFLKKENLYSNTNETELNVLNSFSGENANLSNFDVQDCKQGLFSHVVRRLLEPIVSDKVSTSDKNLEDHNADVCDASINSIPGKEIISKFSNKNGSTFEESSLMQSDINLKSSEFGNCPKNVKFNSSMLNRDEFVTEKGIISKFMENHPPSESKEVEYGIPCRTVFPSENPVMLRGPTKSTLADLQTSCSSSNFRKLKEKIKCFARKEKTHPLIKSKPDRKGGKVSLRFDDEISFKSGSLENSPNLCFNVEKYEAKLKGFNLVNFMNKSSQCPSVSDFQKAVKDQYKSINDAQDQEKSIVKATEHKSLQCPSVSIENSAKIISRFEFKEESIMVPLQRFKQSKKFRRKSSKKPSNKDFIAVAENLPSMNDSGEMNPAKKLKSSQIRLTENSGLILNDISEEKNIECDIEDFNSEEHLNTFHGTYGMHNDLDSFSQSPAMFNISGTNCKITGCLESSFNLQTFIKTKYMKSCAQNAFTELENNFFLKGELLYRNDDDLDTSGNQVNDLQSFSPRRELNEIVGCFKESEEEVHVLTGANINFDLKKDRISIVENIPMEFETSEKDISGKNIRVYSEVVPPNLTDVEYNNVYNSDSDVNKNNLSSLQNECCIRSNEIMECVETVSTDFRLEDISNKSIGIYSKVVSPNSTDVECNVYNFGSDANKKNLHGLQNECSIRNNETMECIETESTGFGLQNEIGSNAFIVSPDLEKSDNSVSSSVTEVKPFININFESDPFTESLPFMLENLSSKNNNLQKDNTFVASPDVEKSNNSVSSPVTELKPACIVNFESNPFTESLPLMLVGLSSEINNNSQQNNCNGKENISNSLSQDLFMESSSSEMPDKDAEVSVNNEQTFNNPSVSDLNDIILHPCSSINKSDNVKQLNDELVGLELKSYSHWKLHLEPESKRKFYVDRVTGNSTYISPKICETDVQSINGISKKSHFFLTHGYSPFISKAQIPESNLKKNPGVQNELKDFIVNNQKHDWYTKWRMSQESSKYNDNSIENMLSGWENPMFDVPYEVTSAANNNISHNVSQMCSFLNSYRFSKNTLNSLQVIGQVDCKFIACILKDYNENFKDQKLLTLFDQHAVHERIRLEEIIEDLYEIDNNGEKSVKTSAISPPLQVSFNDEEIRLLQTYNEKLHKIGIHISMDSESNIYSVNSVPLCLVHKESGQLRRSISDSITILQNATTEWLSSVMKTRSIPQVLPKTLLSVLNYQACRGAVKFGDYLTFEQCNDLLKGLSSCKLPFQCAHGRPSIAPILDLKKVEALYKKRSPPRLRTLFEKLQE